MKYWTNFIKLPMKTKLFFSLTLLVGLVLSGSNVFSQQTKEQTKALSSTISATPKSTENIEVLPGAEITCVIEQRGKTVIIPCFPKGGGDPLSGLNLPNPHPTSNKPNITGLNGESLFLIPLDEFKKLPDNFQLKFTIKPKDPTKYLLMNGASNTVIVNSKKSEGQNIKIILYWQKNAPIKRPGGIVISTGGKYIGEVGPF